ncbi:GOLPH3/VPS74 family protein [Actinoallomurus sp. CA-150999]|uniref:GOLPH3/VPS74 family protein n=1 Tax=Actinoallomurus sp. CA-150999 TaxID=3239887 RepID=UPI003D8ED405
MGHLPRPLPQRLFLLAYSLDKERLTSRSQLGAVLRAAALADLLLDGHITEEDGRPKAVGRGPAGDPFLDTVLDQITAVDGPKSWQHWMRKTERKAMPAVAEQLRDAGLVTAEPRRLIPGDRFELRDRQVLTEYLATVQAALRQPAYQADPRDTAALALSIAGDFTTVAGLRERRRHKPRVRELIAEPVPRNLRRIIMARRIAAGAAGGS